MRKKGAAFGRLNNIANKPQAENGIDGGNLRQRQSEN